MKILRDFFQGKTKRLPIQLTGGVGDVIMALPLIEELNSFEPVEVYSNHPAVIEMFSSFPCFHNAHFKGADYWIVINSVIKFEFGPDFSGFRTKTLTDLYLRYKVNTVDWVDEIENHPHLDNRMAIRALSIGLNRRTLPWFFLGLKPKKLKPLKVPKGERKYITVHQGFETNQTNIKSRSTKNWSREGWKEFVELFKKEYPNAFVIQLGAVTGHDIKGVHINYRNKLNLKQSFEVLGRAICHVDGDSGLVHAAVALGVPSVVMFGSTPKDFFGYEENVNLSSTVCPVSNFGCWWLKPNWLKTCTLDYTTPRCLDAIKPEEVLGSVRKFMEAK